MSQPTPTVFYIAVFREDQSGAQHKVRTSVSGLMHFVESVRVEKLRGFDSGPFDVYVVDTEALECARYDLAPILALTDPLRDKARTRRA